jgi:hypothetical protein
MRHAAADNHACILRTGVGACLQPGEDSETSLCRGLRKLTGHRHHESQVSELEQELVMNSPAPIQAELDACTARLKQLQAACGSKDATIKELRQRLDGHVK